MAVAPTGNIFKALSFDNVSSRTYGVYITGEAVYNAPGRDVEMVEIPGRNGSFALDKGRFQNIEVSYPAGIFADNETDFAEAISDFRNFLCSRRGYARLTDEYNPDEYRMAIYKSGLEVSPAQLRAGEFNIVFDCKPQRFLTSGETAVTVANNGTLTNPTRFESSPLLAVKGYGTIGFNGYEIELTNDVVGHIKLAEATISSGYYNVSYDPNSLNLVELGDTITVHDSRSTGFNAVVTTASYTPTSATLTRTTSNIPGTFSHTITQDGRGFNVRVFYDGNDDFAYSGSYSSVVDKFTLTINYTDSNNNNGILTREVEIAEQRYKKTFGMSTYSGTTSGIQVYNYGGFSAGEITAESTQTLLGTPTYIDCDYGEAYKVTADGIVSLNQYIDLGSDLPKLASGTNTFTKSNTITELKVTPRYWRV